ncbi:hypothetical protein PHLCEN_2v7070 [Hermanssonia centrifuga]|uniref:Uncharacterized protein n=1 Tax=Hermanssonia centrifuga TaxID=98765 RepID=A0A2R6NXK9_9APHY|nr:hypothetical protein PHLCEN_2v7070 [Hermanssonia centrifuga]
MNATGKWAQYECRCQVTSDEHQWRAQECASEVVRSSLAGEQMIEAKRKSVTKGENEDVKRTEDIEDIEDTESENEDIEDF